MWLRRYAASTGVNKEPFSLRRWLMIQLCVRRTGWRAPSARLKALMRRVVRPEGTGMERRMGAAGACWV
jgi:hypothetical protein